MHTETAANSARSALICRSALLGSQKDKLLPLRLSTEPAGSPGQTFVQLTWEPYEDNGLQGFKERDSCAAANLTHSLVLNLLHCRRVVLLAPVQRRGPRRSLLPRHALDGAARLPRLGVMRNAVLARLGRRLQHGERLDRAGLGRERLLRLAVDRRAQFLQIRLLKNEQRG